MVGWLSVHGLVGRGWGFVFLNRHECIRRAALPALLWLFVKALAAVLPVAGGGLSPLDLLASAILTLFVIDWFRFSLRAGAVPGVMTAKSGAAPLSPAAAGGRGERRLAPTHQTLKRLANGFLRVAGRVIVVVLAGTAILLPPTIVLAAGSLAMTGQLGNEAAANEAVSMAMPIAALLASPLLVRFYIYYAALAAGREDVRARDVWRWSRGKSLWLLGVLALALLPAVAASALAGSLTGLAAVLAYLGTMPVFFLSLAVMATVTARAIAGLVVLPVVAD